MVKQLEVEKYNWTYTMLHKRWILSLGKAGKRNKSLPPVELGKTLKPSGARGLLGEKGKKPPKIFCLQRLPTPPDKASPAKDLIQKPTAQCLKAPEKKNMNSLTCTSV